MDEKTRISSIGEAAITLKFVESGYDVFSCLTGKSPFDRVVHKEDKLFKVEIKTTTQRTRYNTGWVVELKRVRSNKTRNKIYKFEKSKIDILAIYIEPLKKVILKESNDIKIVNTLTILDKDII